MLPADQLVDPLGEDHFAEHRRPIIGGQAVLIPLRPLSFLDEAHVQEFVQVVVERAVVDFETGFELRGAHRPGVNEAIEDLIARPVADGGVHIEVLLEGEDAVLRQQVRRVSGELTLRRTRLIRRHLVKDYGQRILSLFRARNSRKHPSLDIVPQNVRIMTSITRDLIAERLGDVGYDRFLFYVMGPHKSFDLNYVLGEEERQRIEVENLPGPLRRLFRNEDDVTSAMIRSASVRWDLRIETYGSEGELVDTLRRFAAEIMHRERRGDLPRLD